MEEIWTRIEQASNSFLCTDLGGITGREATVIALLCIIAYCVWRLTEVLIQSWINGLGNGD